MDCFRVPFLSSVATSPPRTGTRLLGCVIGLCIWAQSAAAPGAGPWAACPESGDPATVTTCVATARSGEADAQRFEEAEALLTGTHLNGAGSPAEAAALQLACGHSHERARRFTAALACYRRALDTDPQHAEARRRYILTASALGASGPAIEQARTHAALLTADELLRLELDAAAMQIRWAALPGAEPLRAHARAALAAHAGLTATLAANPAPLPSALSFDRIAALAADVRMADAAAEFERLQADGRALQDFPVYVLAAAGEAYLYLERPAQAVAVYQAALQQAAELDPQQRFELQTGLFYAHADRHDFSAARALADAMLAAEPAWFNPAPGRFLANGRYAQAREMAAMELAYRERHGPALAALDEMLAIAPGNVGLCLSRAELLRWRGWHDQALAELQRARWQTPDSLRAEVLAGQLALDTRRYAEAQAAVARAAELAPAAKATLRLAERWAVHNRPELSVTARAGRSDGDALSSDDWQIESYYFSAPLRHRYRAFVHGISRYGKFAEGSGRDARLGAGVEYRAPRWSARGELHQGLEQNDAAGASAGLRWYTNDHVELEVRAEANSTNVPLRATRAGVQGDELQVGASYRWDEGRSLSLTAGVLDFDDDNVRRQLQMAYRWRLVNGPRHKLLADVQAYGSRNSETERAYYNPAADWQASAGLTHEWQVFRNYQHALVQRFGVEAGRYWQQDFGSGNVWTLALAHDWLLGSRGRLSYGVSVGGRVYDGERERVEAVFLSLEQRL